MLRLAFRNIFRHRGRATIAVSAIGFGVVAMLLAGGFIEWIFWAMRESTIQSRLGHIQITRPQYFDRGTASPFEYLLSDEQVDEQEIGAAAGHLKVIAPRLNFSGLVSRGEVTIAFVGEGVDPARESEISKVFRITGGQGMAPDDDRGIVMGRGLAANLGVTVGEEVVLLATTRSGGINGVEARVRGLFATGTKAFDDSVLRVPIAMAKSLLRVEGAHTWVVLLDRTEHTESALRRLTAHFRGSETPLEFTPWFDRADFYNKTVALFSRQIEIVRVILSIIIVLSISNTMLMSVLERTGEIGTQMAIGVRRSRVLRLFLYEGMMLGIVGGVCGLIAGFVLAAVISNIGIPMPSPPGMEIEVKGRIMLTWSLTVGAFLMAAVTSTLAGLFPAFKAARLNVVDALRHNR